MTKLENRCTKKYKTIVIDPPWEVKFVSAGVHGKPVTELPYKTMTLDEIKAFPINDFAEDECSLFLWTTNKYLDASFDILKEWGFNFKVVITWDKTEGINTGGFTRRAEFLLFAYRGKFSMDVTKKYFPTVITEKWTTNSAKPKIAYELIKERFPEPRIDIFARKRHPGFDAYGDQVENEIQEVLIN